MVSDSGGVVKIWSTTRGKGGGRAELDGGGLGTWRKRLNNGNGCGIEWWGRYSLL
jgi:hypothetical protein